MFFKKRNNFPWFTLVELLVVITVLSILATIAGIYVFNNISESRDAVRKSDLSNIQKTLELYKIENATYPDPDDYVSITYSGALAWKQWLMWTGAIKSLKNFGSDIPSDPKFGNFYTYSVTNKNKEQQIAWVLENFEELEWLWEIAQIMIPQTHAAIVGPTYATSVDTAYVLGSYNGFMIKVLTGSTDIFIATPSIISYDVSTSSDLLDILQSQKLVYNEFFNLPSSYSGVIDDIDWGFNFNVTDPVLFSWIPSSLKNENNLISFNERLKYVYATTPTESFDEYISILEEDGLNKLKKFLGKYFKIYFKTYFNCFDIKDDGVADGDGLYTVDPDGEGGSDPYDVYCDMTTDGWGWTRKWDNHLTNSSFEWWNDIATEWWSNATNTITNLWAWNTPISWSNYALRQTGSSQSEYQITLDDLSLAKSWDKIILSLWVRDDDNGTTWDSCSDFACNHNSEAWYLFHNRIYYSDGTNDVNGTVEVLDTVITSDGAAWEHQRITNTIRKSVNNFHWYVWYGAEGTTDLYFTWVKIEIFYR